MRWWIASLRRRNERLNQSQNKTRRGRAKWHEWKKERIRSESSGFCRDRCSVFKFAARALACSGEIFSHFLQGKAMTTEWKRLPTAKVVGHNGVETEQAPYLQAISILQGPKDERLRPSTSQFELIKAHHLFLLFFFVYHESSLDFNSLRSLTSSSHLHLPVT